MSARLVQPERNAGSGQRTGPPARARIRCLVWGAAVVLFTAACSLPGQRQTTDRQTYLLQGSATSAAVAAGQGRQCLSLRVSTPASAPGYGTSRIAYTTQPPRLDYFAYHEWVDTPARMIETMMEKRLDASGLLGAVLTGSADIRTDLRLDSQVKRVQQDFTGTRSTFALVVKLGLIDVSTRTLLNSTTLSYAEPVDGAGPEAGVAAANRAADRFLADLTVFVADSIARLSCPSPQAGPDQGSIGPSGE